MQVSATATSPAVLALALMDDSDDGKENLDRGDEKIVNVMQLPSPVEEEAYYGIAGRKKAQGVINQPIIWTITRNHCQCS